MVEFLKENIVFVVSSILIIAGLITVSMQGGSTHVLAVPVSENAPAAGVPGSVPATTTQTLTPSPFPAPTTKTPAPKPAIHGVNTGEGGGFDD